MLDKLKSRLFHTEIGMCAAYYLRNEKPRLKILTPEQTVDYIEKHNCSVARFGEGEFELILGSEYESQKGVSGFQNRNPELIERLKDVLASKEPNLLVCIPYALNNIWGRTQDSGISGITGVSGTTSANGSPI